MRLALSDDARDDSVAGETTTPATRDRIKRLLGTDALAPLIVRLDLRLGKRSDLRGSVSLAAASDETIDAVGGLLGRPPSRSGRVTIRLTELDRAVVAATGVGLVAALTVILGRPPHHGPSQRRENRERWELVRRQWIADRHDTSVPILEWLQSHPPTSVLRRTTKDDLDAALALIEDLRRCLIRLPISPPVSLPIFATQTIGDAHGLDVGRPLHRFLREAIESLHGETMCEAEVRTRDVFGRVGIVMDELSSTVLVMNLRPRREHAIAEYLNQSAVLGEPSRLTFGQLQRYPLAFEVNHPTVHVCENPSVMASAAGRLADRCRPLVCVEGFPSHAALVLIEQLTASQISMRYHGDFDASGLQIATRMIVGKNMQPWRMRATDYEARVDHSNMLLSKNQPIIPTPWDPRLSDCMQEHGKAVLEEMVLDALMNDLDTRHVSH